MSDGEVYQHLGTTSACAENTLSAGVAMKIFWNYLRVRGEYCLKQLKHDLRTELPPRARRIHFCDRFCIISPGTTSACAENTLSR